MNVPAHLMELEESLLLPSTRKDTARLTELLADEFREYGSSGRVYSKREILEALHAEQPCQLSLTAFEVLPLTETIALVTYRSIKRVPGAPPSESLRSSLWSLRDGRWRIVFHEGTKVTSPSHEAATAL